MTTHLPKRRKNLNVSDKQEDNCRITQEYLKKRLEEANISVNRGVCLQQGTKRPKPGTKWRYIDLPPVDEIDGHFGIRTGDGLVVIDVDEWDDLPDSVKSFLESNPTLTIQSPHSEGRDGHYYFATDSNINKNPPGCDIQGDGSIVADGAKIWGIRNGKDCKYDECCTKTSPGVYPVKEDRSIAYVPKENIEAAVPTDTSQGGGSEPKDRGEKIEIPEYDSDIASFAQNDLKKLQRKSMGFFYDLTDRLQGGVGDYTSLVDGGSIDRSKQDTITIQHLYGFFCDTQHYSEERAIELAYNLYSEYCEAYQHTKDGQKRKWITRGDNYREHCIEWAVSHFDANEYRKQLRKSSKHETKNRIRQNKYGEPTYGLARFIVDLAVGEYEDLTDKQIQDMILPQYDYSISVEEIGVVRQLVNNTTMSYDTRGVSNSPCQQLEELYPTKSDVLDFCERVDGVYKGNSNSSFDTALKELQQDGIIKVAQIKSGETYVVYPCDYPDPIEASYVRCGGEKETETQKQIATIPNYD
jgi:hypothetical protein